MAVLAPPAGSLTVPLIVEAYSSTRQSDGTMKTEWTADPIKWRVSLKQLQGQELFEAQQMHGEATHELVGRYRSGLSRKDRFVKPDGATLNIVSLNNVEDRAIMLKVRCKEQV